MKDLIASLRLTILSILVCCVLYPAALLVFGQAVVPWQANGSLLRDETGTVVGSALLSQAFTQRQYFWPRPSAVNYDAAATGGSNLSPANSKLAERASAILERYAPSGDRRLPADLVTCSGSGMDPHISLDAARFQASRVTQARGLPIETIGRLIEANVQASALRGLEAEPVVNVLRLNLALDKAAAGTRQ